MKKLKYYKWQPNSSEKEITNKNRLDSLPLITEIINQTYSFLHWWLLSFFLTVHLTILLTDFLTKSIKFNLFTNSQFLNVYYWQKRFKNIVNFLQNLNFWAFANLIPTDLKSLEPQIRTGSSPVTGTEVFLWFLKKKHLQFCRCFSFCVSNLLIYHFAINLSM